MHVQVSVVNLASSRALKCSKNGSNFDSCVFKDTLKQFGTKCIPFFMTINELAGNFSVCKNFQESQEATQIFQSSGRSCENPCTQVEIGAFCLFIVCEGPFSFLFFKHETNFILFKIKVFSLNNHWVKFHSLSEIWFVHKNKAHLYTQVHVDIIKTPVDELYMKVNSLPVRTTTRAYYFTIQQEVIISQLRQSYSFVSFIADVGGWTGLFLGLSIVSFIKVLLETLKLPKLLSALTLRISLLVASVMIGMITIYCCLKLVDKKTGSKINIEPRINNLSLSLCSLENVYTNEVNKPGDILERYIGDNASFWNQNTKLQNKIRKMEIWFKNGERKTIFDAEINLTTHFSDQSINIPIKGTFIETCHTLDLHYRNLIDRIEVRARKELVCYLHITGQLLHSDSRQGFSIMNPSYVQIVNLKDIILFSSSTFFKMKVLNLTDIINTPYSDIFTYDKCILSLVSGNKFKGLGRLLSSHASTAICEFPINRLNIKYIQERSKKRTETQRNTDTYQKPSTSKFLLLTFYFFINKKRTQNRNKERF